MYNQFTNYTIHPFIRRFGGDRVGLLTGDISINKRAPILVMTTEVFRNMLYGQVSETTNQLNVVCAVSKCDVFALFVGLRDPAVRPVPGVFRRVPLHERPGERHGLGGVRHLVSQGRAHPGSVRHHGQCAQHSR